MNTRLQKMIHAGVIPNRGGVWIDCYNQSVNEDCAGTIIAGINSKNHYFVTEEMKTDTERIVLGWTRDKRGAVVDRHPVEVANAVTSAKRDNTQNYVVEPLNEYEDGVSRIIKAQCQQTSIANLVRKDAFAATGVIEYGRLNKGLSGKVYGVDGVSPTICAEEGVKYNTKIKSNYRIRKLTERECFRLMGVTDSDIDKIQASGISKSQQYKMAGNSIVVDVLENIFDKLFIHTEITSKQLTLF